MSIRGGKHSDRDAGNPAMPVRLCSADMCTGCGACENACGIDAIALRPDSEGFLMPEVDRDRCIECGACERACPVLHPPRLDRSAAPRVYACWNRDEAVRRESASGGMFSVFAEHVLRQAGVVFGAAFDGEMNLKHEGVRRREDLARLRSSKYLQSRQGDAFRQVRQLLQEDTSVLFVGTPCQVAGLYGYLGALRRHRQLLTCDLVCHGVPNQVLFRKYIETLEAKYHLRVTGMNFRHKRSGWLLPSVQVTFEDGRRRFLSGIGSSFQQGFGENKILRRCCHDCRFSTLPRMSDITLGDFWSIGKRAPFPHDIDKGVSLVLVHSERGAQAFDACRDYFFSEERTLEEAKDSGGGRMILGSATKHPAREAVFRDMYSMPYAELAKTYLLEKPTIGGLIRRYFGDRVYLAARRLLGKGRIKK